MTKQQKNQSNQQNTYVAKQTIEYRKNTSNFNIQTTQVTNKKLKVKIH